MKCFGIRALLLFMYCSASAACAHTPRPSHNAHAGHWRISTRYDKDPSLACSMALRLSSQTQLGLHVQAVRYNTAIWHAPLGMPRQAQLWNVDARRSFVARDIGRWQLRLGGWPHVRRRYAQQDLSALPMLLPSATRPPWGVVLSRPALAGDDATPEVVFMWGTTKRRITAYNWAWHADHWQPPLRCQTSRDCPHRGVCTQRHECVWRYGQSAGQQQLARFALDDAVQVTAVRVMAQQSWGPNALAMHLDAQHRRLCALSAARAVFVEHGHIERATQLAWRATLAVQWGRAGPAIRAASAEQQRTQMFGNERPEDAPTLALLDAQDGLAPRRLHPARRKSYGHAQARLSCDAQDTFHFDMQQYAGRYKMGAGVVLRHPPRALSRIKKHQGIWPLRAHLKVDALLWRHTTLWLAPQWQHAADAKKLLQLEAGARRLERGRAAWSWQARIWHTCLSCGAADTACIRGYGRVSKTAHLRGKQRLRLSMGLGSAGASIRLLEGAVHWRMRHHALQLTVLWRDAQRRGRSEDALDSPGHAPFSMRLGARGALGALRADLGVSLALADPGPNPATRLVASLSMPL